MEAPPSRYKVVEQGRRLVVLDTWNGDAPVVGKAAAPVESERPRTVEQARAALRPARRPPAAGLETSAFIVTTQSWFDDKAPRRVRLGSEEQSKLAIVLVIALPVLMFVFVGIGWPAMLVGAFLFLQPRFRKALRQAITPLLDGLEAD